MQEIAADHYDLARLSQGRQESWRMVFGIKSKEAAIAYVRKEWFPPDDYLHEFLAEHQLTFEDIFSTACSV